MPQLSKHLQGSKPFLGALKIYADTANTVFVVVLIFQANAECGDNFYKNTYYR